MTVRQCSLPPDLTDAEINDVLGNLRILLDREETPDFKFCEATKKLLWKLICTSGTVPYTFLRDRYADDIMRLLSQAAERSQSEVFRNNILARMKEVDRFFNSGKVQLTEKARNYIAENFKRNAEQIIHLLDNEDDELD